MVEKVVLIIHVEKVTEDNSLEEIKARYAFGSKLKKEVPGQKEQFQKFGDELVKLIEKLYLSEGTEVISDGIKLLVESGIETKF